MLGNSVLEFYSLAVIAALGGSVGYLSLACWTELRGVRLWAAAAVISMIFLFLLHPSAEALDEVRTWLLPDRG